jgi:hypothetical protein
VRTVVVKSPSARSEAGLLFRAVQLIAVATLIVIGVERAALAPKRKGAAPQQLLVGEMAFAALASPDQRQFNRVNEGLSELEDVRSRTGEWATPDAMKARSIPPFADDPIDAAAGYQWRMLRQGDVINYVGTPAASGRPTWLIVLVEPAAGTPIDPTAVVDETHYKLPDGAILHVSVWIGADVRAVDRPIAFPAPEEGWRRVTSRAR